MKKDFILYLYRQPQTVFTTKEISLFFPEINYPNLKRRLNYYAKTNKLTRLRKSIYAKENYNPLELANKVYSPSYISLETVLQQAGIIFQPYQTIFAASYLTRKIIVDSHEIAYRRIKSEILLNKNGIEEKDNYFIASKERAFLDAVFLYKNYHFDNLKLLDWDKIMDLQKIYRSHILEKRTADYHKIAKEEYV